MDVTKNGACQVQAFMAPPSLTRSGPTMLHSYTLPIGAVDTHRPKPGSTPQPAQLAGFGREYYGDSK